MTYRLLLCYQIGVAASDSFTGIALLFAPLFTLRLMQIQVQNSSAIYIAWIGIFVVSVGMACAYGAGLLLCKKEMGRLETVWLLTAITRGLVAAFLLVNILNNTLSLAWGTVAVFDGGCALFQCVGLRKEWLKHAVC